MKRMLFLFILTGLFVVLLAGCSLRNDDADHSSAPISDSTPSANTSSMDAAVGNQDDTQPEKGTDSQLVAAVQGIIQQYINGEVDTQAGLPGASGPTFDPEPEDFEFPEIKSESDFEAVREIRGSDRVIVYIKGTGERPYMNIHIDPSEDYEVTSVVFMCEMPE